MGEERAGLPQKVQEAVSVVVRARGGKRGDDALRSSVAMVVRERLGMNPSAKREAHKIIDRQEKFMVVSSPKEDSISSEVSCNPHHDRPFPLLSCTILLTSTCPRRVGFINLQQIGEADLSLLHNCQGSPLHVVFHQVAPITASWCVMDERE
jgi:hypothetical protein